MLTVMYATFELSDFIISGTKSGVWQRTRVNNIEVSESLAVSPALRARYNAQSNSNTELM